jgi:hypothetical protein
MNVSWFSIIGFLNISAQYFSIVHRIVLNCLCGNLNRGITGLTGAIRNRNGGSELRGIG